MKIVFNDKAKTVKDYEISFDGVLATIITEDKPILDGFTTYGLYDVPIVDGSKYTTLYRQLEGKYQLSNDGSIYVPPTPPKPPVPVHSTLEADGVEYDVTDFDGSSFIIEKEIEGCIDIFSSLESFKVNGITYEHMVFISAIYVDETHTRVTFRQKSDIEVKVDAITPYKDTKKAYIGDTFIIFENVKGTLNTVYCILESGLNIPTEIEQNDGTVTVSFEALKEVATITISAL